MSGRVLMGFISRGLQPEVGHGFCRCSDARRGFHLPRTSARGWARAILLFNPGGVAVSSDSPTPASVLLTSQTVQHMLGVSRVTLWRMTKSGDFPQSICVGARAVRWVRAEVEEWIGSRPRSGEAA